MIALNIHDVQHILVNGYENTRQSTSAWYEK